MKHRSVLISLVLSAALLCACGAPSGSNSGSSHSASSDNPASSDSQDPLTLSPMETRWYPEFQDQLIPRDDYGSLFPFRGAYAGNNDHSAPYGYGLMTQDGVVVLDSVLDDAYHCSYQDADGEFYSLPVLTLTKEAVLWEEWGSTPAYALASLDGSWVTGFDFFDVIPFPGGVAVSDPEKLSILDPESGAVLRSWTWEELGIVIPLDSSFSPGGGERESSPQWALGAIYLGRDVQGEARMLDPETGVVTTLPLQQVSDYITHIDQDLRRGLVSCQVSEDESIILTFREQEYRLPGLLSQDVSAWVTEDDQVILSQRDGLYAVVSLNGDVIFPVQPERIEEFSSSGGESLLAVQQGNAWQLYDSNGSPLASVPGSSDSWGGMAGPFVEISEENSTSYYDPVTGTCVLRTHWELQA